MDYLPISLDIKSKPCLVIGGGSIALRKSKQLLNAGAALTVVAPHFHPSFLQLKPNHIKLITAHYQSEFLNDQLLVIAATDNEQTNEAVYKDAEKKSIIVNVVDQSELCRFIMPSVIDRSPLTIAISSGGSAPVMARMLREKIEWILPRNVGKFLSKIRKDRKLIAHRYPDMNDRRQFWEGFFENILGWSAVSNLASTTPLDLDINYNLDEINASDEPGKISEIDFKNGEIDDLTIGDIKLLQKADEVYLSNHNYNQLKNIIRRDANIFLREEHVININSIMDNYAESDKKKVVVLTSSHSVATAR